MKRGSSRGAQCCAALLMAACGAQAPDDLADGMLLLPDALREVSAVAAIDANTVACVQDEHGILFVVDLAGKAEPQRRTFAERGDYEGLAKVGDAWWVLRADGVLLRVVEREGALHVDRTTRLPGDAREWESLCFDGDRNRLLAMPKGGPAGDKGAREQRAIVAIDPASGEVAAAPVLVLDRRQLIERAEVRGLALPTRTTPKGKERVVFEFAPSEIAVVPGSSDLLVLFAGAQLLLRIDAAGEPVATALLDAKRLPQPEGLAFLPDGRLLVASEGAGGQGRLVVVPVPAP